MFADREDVFNSGLHGHPLAGIFGTKAEGGAFSIVLNEGYEDDEDRGETMSVFPALFNHWATLTFI